MDILAQWQSYGLDIWRIVVPFLRGAGDSPLLQNIDTMSRDHSVFHLMAAMNYFPGITAVWMWSWPITTSAIVRHEWFYISHPHMTSQHNRKFTFHLCMFVKFGLSLQRKMIHYRHLRRVYVGQYFNVQVERKGWLQKVTLQGIS